MNLLKPCYLENFRAAKSDVLKEPLGKMFKRMADFLENYDLTEEELREEVKQANEKLVEILREYKGVYYRSETKLANLPASEMVQTV
jgi:hypothetical protein